MVDEDSLVKKVEAGIPREPNQMHPLPWAILVEILFGSFFFLVIASVAVLIGIFINYFGSSLDQFSILILKLTKFFLLFCDTVLFIKFISVNSLRAWREII